MSRVKEAFLDGARKALEDYGVVPKKEKSLLRRALPWAVGSAAGLGAYKLLRTPSFSANPALRKIQQRAATKGFHRIVDVTPGASSKFLAPVVNEGGDLSLWNKLKLFLNEGTTEAIPVHHVSDDVTKVVGKSSPVKVKGVVQNRNVEMNTRNAVRGGIDVEGSPRVQRIVDSIAKGGKKREAELFNKYAPSAIPETHTDISHLFQGLPADRAEAIAELQKRFVANHGNDFILKPNIGLASGGEFPRSSNNWADHIKQYDAHMADPVQRKAFEDMVETGGNALSGYLRDYGLYEGQILHDALKDPSSIIAQKLVPNAYGESRVHTFRGTAPPGLTGVKGQSGKVHRLKQMVSDEEVRKFVEAHLQKLPQEYRDGNYGFDVLHHKNPDGTRGFKILEMNPMEIANDVEAGGGSGWMNDPFMGHSVYRQMTGRHTPLVAGLGGLGVAGAVGAGAHKADED